MTADYLPALPTSRAPAPLAWGQRRADRQLCRQELSAWVAAETDQLETAALGTAMRAATQDEFDFVDEFIGQAVGSQLKQLILADKALSLSRTNTARIEQTFSRRWL